MEKIYKKAYGLAITDPDKMEDKNNPEYKPLKKYAKQLYGTRIIEYKHGSLYTLLFIAPNDRMRAYKELQKKYGNCCDIVIQLIMIEIENKA